MKKRSILLNGLTVVIASLVILLFKDHFFSSTQEGLREYLSDFLGLAIISAGQILRIITRGYKSEQLHISKKVITDGPYAFVRHPMYLGSFLIGLGATIILLNFYTVLLYIILYQIWYGYQIKIEQEKLLSHFGQDYTDYSETTPSMFPNFRSITHTLDIFKKPLKLKWIIKEMPTISAWAISIAIFEGYQDIFARSLSSFTLELTLFILIFIIALSLARILNFKMQAFDLKTS